MKTLLKALAVTLPLSGITGVATAAGEPAGDFNGDGRSDVMWRNYTSGADTIWLSADSRTALGMASVTDTYNWEVIGSGDFDGDGRADLVWLNLSTRASVIWRSGNFNTRQQLPTLIDASWYIAGFGDFDGDGKSDILWRNGTTGANVIWKSGNAYTRQTLASVGLGWALVVGDFDGDGKSDIFWRNIGNFQDDPGTGADVIWPSANFGLRRPVAAVTNQSWTVSAVGDFDGDGKTDLFWRNWSTGANTIWKSADPYARQTTPAVSTNWSVEVVGDFDGDGRDDLLWRYFGDASGRNVIWKSGNAATRQDATPVPITDYGWTALTSVGTWIYPSAFG